MKSCLQCGSPFHNREEVIRTTNGELVHEDCFREYARDLLKKTSFEWDEESEGMMHDPSYQQLPHFSRLWQHR